MSFAVFLLLLVAALVGFIDFMIGEQADRRFKDEQLTDYYVAVEAGDWSRLYRYPAGKLEQYLSFLLGSSPLSLRFVLRVALMSVCLTSLIFVVSMSWTYVEVRLSATGCKVPGLGQFAEIPAYMSTFLLHILAINIPFDYVAWSVSLVGLRALIRNQPGAGIAVLLGVPLFAFALLWDMYLVYLPLTIKIQANSLGLPFGWRQYTQIMLANVGNISGLFSLPGPLFTVTCEDPGHSIFSITHIGTMQILALETMLPTLLFVIFTAFGILAFASRRFTAPVVALFIQRLQEHPKSIGTLVSIAIVVIAGLVTALGKSRGAP